VEETVLVRAEVDREEGRDGFVDVLFLLEDEKVREGTEACVGGFEAGDSLVFGAGLVAASTSSFSNAFTFRVSESTWKLSFLRSLSTLGMADGENAPKIRKHHHLQQVFIIRPLYFSTLLLQIFLHLVASLLKFLETRLQAGFLPENIKLTLQCGYSFLVLSVIDRELQFNARGFLLQCGMILSQSSQPTSKVRNLGLPVDSGEIINTRT
jgi:hypothetical protein